GVADLTTLLPAKIAGVNGETLSISYTSAGNTATAHVDRNGDGTVDGLDAYAITGAVADGSGSVSNYDVTLHSGKLSVTPASLTITADNKTKFYGSALPTLTASYSGFVNGETVASLTQPTLSTVAANSDAGTYAITALGAKSTDYDIR